MPLFLEPEDVARRYGTIPGEQSSLRFVWLLDSTQDDLLRWLAERSPALERLRPGDLSSADFTADELSGVVREFERHVSLTVSHEGGLLHEVAQHAANEGRAALVVDETSFFGPTAFAAFTIYEPGAERRTLWIDPLRGLMAPVAELNAVLGRFIEPGLTVDTWVATLDRGEPGKMVGIVHFIEHARLLRPPEFRPLNMPRPHEVRPRPLPTRQTIAEESARPSRTWSGLIALLLLAPAAPIAPWFWSSLGHVSNLEGALIAAAFSVLSVGWLAFLPLGWLSFKWRAAWFIGVPLLISLGYAWFA
ncbi:MAG: hypothetical protein QM817_04985 [Archangium sp.]